MKKIIQCLKNASESNQRVLESVVEKFLQIVIKHVKLFLDSKGIFIVIAIIESSDFKETLIIILKKYMKYINELPNNSGVQVLRRLLAN